MNRPSALKYALCVAAALLAAGCAGASSAPAVPGMTGAHSTRAAAKPPPPCIPRVWASSLGSNAVYGFTAPSSLPCVTLAGPYNGLYLNAPIALAISRFPRALYVADLNNNRILVFRYNGTFVKWWSTTLGSAHFQPWGVCVSPLKGIVGVANRQYNNTGPPGNVEFFLPTAASGSTPSGYANGVLTADQWCAFDKAGNFFVDGSATSSQVIAYLPRAYVNAPAQTLSNSGLGSGSFWVGMYSRINSPPNDTLSVGTSVPYSSTETIDNWKVAGPPSGPLTFTALAPYTLSSYPSTIDAVYQLAPGRPVSGTTGNLYIADYGASQVLYGPNNGGAVSLYNNVSGTVGVATRPTGQY